MSPSTALHIIVVAALLAGCGRRGALEEPGGPAPASTVAPTLAPIAPNAASAGQLSTLDPGSPGAQEPGAAAQAGPERRFLLDPLL